MLNLKWIQKCFFAIYFSLAEYQPKIIMFKPKMSVSDIIRLSRISAENLAKPAELSKKYGRGVYG